MKRVAVLFPAFLGGGAEAVCAWMLEALKEDFRVVLITLSDVHLGELDAQYGTTLAESGVEILRVPLPASFGSRLAKSLSMFSFRQFYLSKYYKNRLASQFDLAISAFNEMDFGHGGIQYVHFPMFGAGSNQVRHIVGYPDSKLRRVYKKLLKIWAGWSEERMRENVTLVNSMWTAELVRKIYSINPRVVYPPIVLNYPEIPWQEREDGFVLVSRIVRHKNVESAIHIIARLRQKGFSVNLYVLGEIQEREYFKELSSKYGNYSWIVWKGQLEKMDYMNFITRNRYGIHTWKWEPFGVGVAEMVTAGLIPFVPAEGGQVEIVGNNKSLLWKDEEEAVVKITRVLSNQDLQEELRYQLSKQSKKWTLKSFKQEILTVVQEAIEG